MSEPDITLDTFGIAGPYQEDLHWSDTERIHYVRKAVTLLAKRGGSEESPKSHFLLARWIYEAEEHGRARGVHQCIGALRSGEEWLARTRKSIEQKP